MLTRSRIPWLAATASLAVWALLCTHWWSVLDSDSALYPLMSLDVLKDRHYLMTAGQSHGGTLLVYIRALLFQLFGVSHFLGFFVNGMVVAAAAGLWTRFAYREGGAWAGMVFGALSAVGTAWFAMYSCTDYYALSLLLGGAILNLAARYARTRPPGASAVFGIGALIGFSIYTSRFTLFYILLATAVFIALLPEERRRALAPVRRDFGRPLPKLLSAAVGLAFLSFILAFFTNDRFLGMNAEVSLKLTAVLGLAVYRFVRPEVFRKNRRQLLLLAAGGIVGFFPEVLHRAYIVAGERSTGLVRWENVAGLLPLVPQRIGAAFSKVYPLALGLASLAGLVLLVGLASSPRKLRRGASRLFWVAAAGAAVPVAAWFLVHTYMHMVTQYLYPAYFPLYLAAALAVGASRTPARLAALALPALTAGIVDLHHGLTVPNHRAQGGVIERLRAQGVKAAAGSYWSTYDLMWVAKGEVLLNPLDGSSRFPHFLKMVRKTSPLAYVYRQGDIGTSCPEKEADYIIQKKLMLPNGYVIETLSPKSVAQHRSIVD